MSTQLKNCKFSDKVPKEDADGKLGNIKANVESGDATHDGEIYVWIGGDRYQLYLGEEVSGTYTASFRLSPPI